MQKKKQLTIKMNNSGITLIALTVTIVLLLILATISIKVAIQSGLIEKADDVKDESLLLQYQETIKMITLEQYTKKVTSGSSESLKEMIKSRVLEEEWAKSVEDVPNKDDQIKVTTKENYVIIAEIDDLGNAIINPDNEPKPTIKLAYAGKNEGKYQIKASATVEKTEKTSGVTRLEIVGKDQIINNYEDGKEVIFEVETTGKYWIKATTNYGKSANKLIEIKEDESTEVKFDITIDQDNYVYDGTAKEPSVTVKDGEKTLTKGTHYIVEYSNNINAGTATVKITGKEKYSEKIETKTFTIGKASLIVTSDNKTITYGETVPTYTYKVTGYVNNETSSVLRGTVSYTIKNSSGATVTISKTTNVGTYTIEPLGLSAANYNITYKTGTLIINKATPTMTVSNASKIIQDGSSSTFTYTYDGGGAVTVKSSDTSIATCSVNTSTKTVTVNALKTSTKAATITVSAADGTNYTSTSATVQIGAIVISGVPTSWTKNDVKLTATTTLTGHRLQMMGESGTWQTTSSQTFTKNGTLSVRVLDSSLTSVGTKSVTITKIDKTAPEISAYDATVSKNVITASMTATDNCGVTPSYSYKIGTGSYQASNKFTVTTAGTYTIYFRAVDVAGNEKVVSKQVTISSYTVTYNANGGTGAPASQTAISGVNLTLSNIEPTRTGYTFLGWSISNTATTAMYAKGATYTANRSVTLYAIWKPEKGILNIFRSTYPIYVYIDVNNSRYYTSDDSANDISTEIPAGASVKISFKDIQLATGVGPNKNQSVYTTVNSVTPSGISDYQEFNSGGDLQITFTMPSGSASLDIETATYYSGGN